jgi:uncharacterized MnhB-related membrane protein
MIEALIGAGIIVLIAVITAARRAKIKRQRYPDNIYPHW